MIDYLILGGGSAGCVLAARLSEDPEQTVCLVEAGQDITRASMPADIRSRYPGRAYLDTGNIWPRLQAAMTPQGCRRYEQARLLGGGSAINALMANRGAPADYDEWARLGADGWNWESCLPYFCKLESDCDFEGPGHGRGGPVRIRRTREEDLSPFVGAVMAELAGNGYPRRPDQNGAWEDGTYLGTLAISVENERIPASVCYLTDEVRARPNLSVRPRTLVTRLICAGNRVTGALLRREDGPEETLSARHVIVCAGAIHSPALLLRSGIGPAADLAKLGIAPVRDLPGVGANLMEHPSIAVSALLQARGRTPFPQEHHEQAIVRFSSGLPGTVAGDMHGAILARSGWHSIGYRLGTLFFWVNKSYSRGRLTLASADPRDEPQVDFNMLSDKRDLERLKQALRFGARTLTAASLRDKVCLAFPTSYSPRVARIAMPSLGNAVQRGLFSLLLDIAGPLRRWLIGRFVTEGVTLKKLLADDTALTDFVRRNVGGTWHPSGTCRMGRADDPLAVTTADGKVHGMEGLRVCDASLMPSIPCANTNVPTLMIAERIADLIKAERAGAERGRRGHLVGQQP